MYSKIPDTNGHNYQNSSEDEIFKRVDPKGLELKKLRMNRLYM